MAKSKSDPTLVSAVGSIPLPSSDLIQYRFDQIDAKLEKFDQKLDLIGSAYMPRHEADERYNDVNSQLRAIRVRMDTLKETDDLQQGAIDATRRFTTIAMTLLGIIVAAVSTYFGLKAH